MRDAIRIAEEAENARQDAFRRNEDARDRIFKENEARRDQDVVKWKNELKRDLDERLTAFSTHTPACVAVPDEEAVEHVEFVDSVEGTAPERSTSPDEPIISCHDETAPQDSTLVEIVKSEREQAGRLFDAFMEERKRHDQELIEERERLHEERDMRIAELGKELAGVRGGLELEEQFREVEEVERREMELANTVERHEDLKASLNDVVKVVQEQRDDFLRPNPLNEARWNEKLSRREEWSADAEVMRGMLCELLSVQRASVESSAEVTVGGTVTKTGKISIANDNAEALIGFPRYRRPHGERAPREQCTARDVRNFHYL